MIKEGLNAGPRSTFPSICSLLFCVNNYTQVLGWPLVLGGEEAGGLLSNATDVTGGGSEAGGEPIPQIFWDAFMQVG